jgi:transcriptional regulator GlxA family with amidase domain
MRTNNNGEKSSSNVHTSREKDNFGSLSTLNAFKYYECLRRIKEAVEKDSLHKLTLEEVAKIACREPKYFSSFFRKKVGITFVAWRTYLRINKAKELIRTSDYSLTYVCSSAGFGDMRTFERAFKKYTGQSPRGFKQSICTGLDKGFLPIASQELSRIARKTPRHFNRLRHTYKNQD